MTAAGNLWGLIDKSAVLLRHDPKDKKCVLMPDWSYLFPIHEA